MGTSELGEFLRASRERVTPEAVGIIPSGRRRTSGLRREEVAARANISVTYYTFLEQGRDIRPSPNVVRAIAEALVLSTSEYAHLQLLVEPNASPSPGFCREVDVLHSATRELVRRVSPLPAYVTDRYWDVLDANQAAELIWEPWSERPPGSRNMALWTLTEARAKKVMPQWEDEARKLVGRIRATAARYPGDRRFAELKEQVLGAGDQVRRWWDEHQVAPVSAGKKRLWHPATGEFDCPYAVHLVADSVDVKVIVLQPDAATLAVIANELS